MCNQRQFTDKEIYVIGAILDEVSEKWHDNRIYQSIKNLISEKLNAFVKEQEELEFKREYECIWVENEDLEK